MALAFISVTREDFDRCDWQTIIASSSKRTCDAYASTLHKMMLERQAQDDSASLAVLELLYHLCLIYLNIDKADELFGPAVVTNIGRSAIIDDFTDAQFQTLETVVSDVNDAELRARIADILWLKRRGGFQMAQTAIHAYLESAQNLEHPDEWSESFRRVERVLRLAAQLGRNNNEPLVQVIAHIEAVLDKYGGEDRMFLSARLMELLLEQRQGDPAKYAALSEKAALRAEAAAEEGAIRWHKARTYWSIKAQWHHREGNQEAAQEARTRVAETYVGETEDALQEDSLAHFKASHFLEQAITAYRQIPGTQQRRDELHKRLLDYQRASIAEFQVYSQTMDVRQWVEQAIQIVEGKSLHEALLSLALASNSPDVTRLRQTVEEHHRQFPLSFIFPARMLDEQGRVIARKPGIDLNEKQLEEAIRSEMFRYAQHEQKFFAEVIVQHAIEQINLEHQVGLGDILPIVTDNPFVPPNREYLYAKGLYAGLTGDLVVAAHLLVPQIEHSLRHILVLKGISVSGIDQYGIQEEYPLGAILNKYRAELEHILGENILFDLRGLLVERFGSNLRNQVSHGLLDQGAFFSWYILYLWWLTLRLCYLPMYSQIIQTQNNTV